MSGGTAALLVVGAAGAGAAVYFFVIKPRQAAAAGVGITTTPKPAAPAVSTASVLATGDHVSRKHALAPSIVDKVTGGIIPSNVTKPIVNIANKLDVSGYAQRYVTTKVPIVGKIAEAPVSAAKSVISTVSGWFS